MDKSKIVVKFKKVERHGQIKDQIIEVNAFPKNRLPKEYLTDGLYVFMKMSKAKVPMLVTPVHTYVVGEALTTDQVKEMLEVLEKAGDRLHYINGVRKMQHAKDVETRRNLVGKEWAKVI